MPLPSTLAGLQHLRHIAIDTHMAPIVNGLPNTTTPALWPAIVALTKTWGCPLTSITLRLSDKVALSHSFVEELLDAHGAALEHIALINVDAAVESVRAIAGKVKQLDRLAIHIPTKDVVSLLSWGWPSCSLTKCRKHSPPCLAAAKRCRLSPTLASRTRRMARRCS